MNDRCKKVNELLDDMATSSNNKKLFKKYNFSVSDFRVAEICLKELVEDGKTECVQEAVMKMFKSFGFSAKEKGTGWKIV